MLGSMKNCAICGCFAECTYVRDTYVGLVVCTEVLFVWMLGCDVYAWRYVRCVYCICLGVCQVCKYGPLRFLTGQERQGD
jgi:hypothetical protein